jgi:cyanophycin synthetase
MRFHSFGIATAFKDEVRSRKMRIVRIRVISGPNVFAYQPVLKMTLDLEDWAETDSLAIPHLAADLCTTLPGLQEHRCSIGKPGGFVERLNRGTYLGHIIEHVALELSTAAGIGVGFGKTVYAGSKGHYDVIVAYKSEEGMTSLLKTAVDLVSAIVNRCAFDLLRKIDDAREIVRRTKLGPSTQAIVDAAEAANIPWSRVGTGSIVRLGYGQHTRFIQAAMTSRTSAVAVELVSDKGLTKQLLAESGLPVPEGMVIASANEAADVFQTLGKPLVVKPLDGNQGKGISLNVSNSSQLEAAVAKAAAISPAVVVERQVEGQDFRILIVGGKFCAASRRTPAHIDGDGLHTIRELVEIANDDPLRGDGHEAPLTRLQLDDDAEAILETQGLAATSVPSPGQRAFLRTTANLSTGGTAEDVTDAVSPDIRSMCERAARVVGMDVCGIDLIATDIGGASQWDCAIVEINAAPGLRMHHHPSKGKCREVGAAIIDNLYPAGMSSRIPIISVTGTNGKTTVVRMIASACSAAGYNVGMTSTHGIYIGSERITTGDCAGPQSARVVLQDPSVEIAVLETARGGITRRGLGYDWSDIGILTNIQADHIGQDGLETVEDLLRVKCLVGERVKPGGTLILNADDPLIASVARMPAVVRHRPQICFFSLRPFSQLGDICSSDPNTSVLFLVDNSICEARGSMITQIAHVADFRVTMGGAAKFQIANLMAALAACRAHKLSLNDTLQALKAFGSEQDNAGRLNLYHVRNATVMVDYGHNIGAFKAVAELIDQWRDRKLSAVLGMPGDRPNFLIEECAQLAARAFSRVIIREDDDTRGRVRGELADIIHRTIRREKPGVEAAVVLNESEAVDEAVRGLMRDELLIIFYDSLQNVMEVLDRHGAVAADHIQTYVDLRKAS